MWSVADHRQQAVTRILERRDYHEGKYLAEYAKRGSSRKERKKRWAAIAVIARRRQLSQQDAHHFRKAHRFYLWFKWARAKVRRIKQKIRRDRHQGGSNAGSFCGALLSEWAGSRAAGECVVVHNAAAYGDPITSRKRAANDPLSISNPDSDHNMANTTAYAWDIATFNGASLAHAIAHDLGISGYSTGNYASYYISRPWGRFRVQILWAVEGHFNHVHVGIRRD